MMKLKTDKKIVLRKKQPAPPVKGSLETISEYFGNYLSALAGVSQR